VNLLGILRRRVIVGILIIIAGSWLAADALLRSANTETGAERTSLAIVMLAAMALAAIIVIFADRSLTLDLRQITRSVEHLAEGEAGPGFVERPSGALGELADAVAGAGRQVRGELSAAGDEGGRYATILQQMTDAVVAVDQRGRIRYCNQAFGRIFELGTDEIVDRQVEGATLSYRLGAIVSRVLQQGNVQHERIQLAQPREMVLDAVVSPLLDRERQLTGAVALLHDVTHVAETARIRQEFVANAGHELRTPAAAIKALAEALESGALNDPEHAPSFLRQIVDAADRLAEILDDMLTLSRVERGATLLEPEYLRACQALEDAAAQVRPTAEAGGVTLSLDCAPEERVYADARSLRTLLVNLLDNAVKYTPPGGSVSARGRSGDDGYELSVQDTGIGIPKQHLDRIFERFYRVDVARDRVTGSTGLGLAIVKHIAEAHGGRVSVASTPGEGSTFTVVLPSGPRRS
jgi:two-component system phosphate regulon sensor histidine kinase PhoR